MAEQVLHSDYRLLMLMMTLTSTTGPRCMIMSACIDTALGSVAYYVSWTGMATA